MDSRTKIHVQNLQELSSQIQFLICDQHTQQVILYVASQKCHACTTLLSHLVDTFSLASHFALRSKTDMLLTMSISASLFAYLYKLLLLSDYFKKKFLKCFSKQLFRIANDPKIELHMISLKMREIMFFSPGSIKGLIYY